MAISKTNGQSKSKSKTEVPGQALGYSLQFTRLTHLLLEAPEVKWFTEFGHLNRGDMLTSEQHRCHNEKKKFQRR
ncbi:MAG: hypothetical protein E7C42_06940, partial [Klebsiella michiganensis]|nr:hypothetical protein [Klebsiella michiganensis]